VFFSQFLDVSGHFDSLCETCPVRFTSPNAPLIRDAIGTVLMGVLCGHWRYAHLSGVRFDAVNPQLLGMTKVVSEDSARRFLGAMSPEQSGKWLHTQLRNCYDQLLVEPWVLDVDTPLMENSGVVIETEEKYEYIVLVTNMDMPIVGLAQFYRDRADVENCFDELKNQWGWGGFTTKDVERSQTMARLVALIYNWWSLFAGLINPDKHAEAITSRPELLFGVGRIANSGRQSTLTVTSTHKNAALIQKRQTWVGHFLSRLGDAAEQLSRSEIWRLILSRVFIRFLGGRIIGEPENHAIPALA